MNSANRNLASWKEIANYLGVNVRTAQKWEQARGLPVRRLPGARGRVEADIDEIDKWKNAAPPTDQPKLEWKRLAIAATGAALLVSIAGFVFVHRNGPPAEMQITEDTLIVSDADGHRLWHHLFDHRLAAEVPDGFPSPRRRVWFGDLDGDGTIETIFVDRPAEYGSRSEVLICFSEGGQEKWRFTPGREVRTRGENFSNRYEIAGFWVEPMGRNRPETVLVSSSHATWWPTQIALLSAHGRMLREYWHSGHLRRVRLADFDGNGVSEIYLGGINNARHAATLVVLDPDSFSGASLEDNPDGQLLDFPSGKEQARLLFPRTCVNQKYESYNGVESLQFEGATILVGVLERFSPQWRPLVFYELGSDLKVRMVDFSTTFRAYHAELESTHQLDHRLSDRELEDLHSIHYLQVN